MHHDWVYVSILSEKSNLIQSSIVGVHILMYTLIKSATRIIILLFYSRNICLGMNMHTITAKSVVYNTQNIDMNIGIK